MVHALVRLQVSAIDPGEPLGRLTTEEQEMIGERLISFYGFNTRRLVQRRLAELADIQRARQPEG